MPQERLEEARREVLEDVLEHVEQRRRLLVVKAPPGSGKTHVTLRAVALARHRKQRVAVATQTNAQADDFCRRMAQDFPRVTVHRFAKGGYEETDLGSSVEWIHAGRELPVGPCVVVSTSAKWALTETDDVFDFLFVDEAWQMTWADLMLLSRIAERFVLVGDPGQIPPVVSIDVSRWQTSRRPPHHPAPEVILRDPTLRARALALPVSTRLPFDTVELVRQFYDFHFDSWAAPGERRFEVKSSRAKHGIDAAIDLLTAGSVVLLTLPTPDAGPPLEEDRELADLAAQMANRMLERKVAVLTEDGRAALRKADIGVAATHRIMNTRLSESLGNLVPDVRVDTPERWQGLERAAMIVVHPLSGVTEPSSFDLSTGRLCVMASRHRVGLILVSRDHVGATLREYLPAAEQAVGLPDENGRGHGQNLGVWQWLERNGRIVAVR